MKRFVVFIALLFCLVSSVPSYAYEVGEEWSLINDAKGQNGLSWKEKEEYLSSLLLLLNQNGGVINERRYTEYSKTVLALTAIGQNPAKLNGYDLLAKLSNERMVIRQGINGPIWALIALSSGNYASSSKEKYLQEILSAELPDGGWNMEKKGTADPDVTAMALQALAFYKDRPGVKKAVDRALKRLSELQDDDGGYASWGTKNSESVSQVIIALCELGIPLTDSRFVKNGKTTLDNLKSFQLADGNFMHTKEIGKADALATEQGNTALTEVWRAEKKLRPLYQMDTK